MDAFPSEVHPNLKWYVYRLIDPRNGNTFYVGKGCGDRVFEHARGAIKEEDIEQNEAGLMGLRTSVIQDIRRAGLSPLHVIHRHGLESADIAYEVEAALIDAYPGLTNLVGGHGSAYFGCRSVEQIVSAYAAKPLVVGERLILIFVGKTLDDGRSIYDAVRGIWKMSRSKAEKCKLVLAYDGVLVVGAYRPERWLEGTRANFPYVQSENPKRIGFEGKPAEVWDAYVGARVPPRAKGAANPIRYLAPNGERSGLEDDD
ncbi:hypothetical protein JQ616_31920 [Bradyrhizobium tropiciagri]|uniref:LEM-3-like GIY-YIG domain-containing protein n=1 Tax=Bradyrhizobium tropiciagri TaxID=312253 RepID=UPI001BAA4662|nr:hypothetical protein [Bradyrhizobium tropiciagri]MBR0899583.1 hypothetical protein [Bradyrhizobium tropiciagri]